MTLTDAHRAHPRCEANLPTIRVVDYGFERIQCHQFKGLRTLFDADGQPRYACGALGHVADVVRRFGVTPLRGRDHCGHDRRGAARGVGTMTRRVEFRLSMPSTGSWNGRWSGEGRNYAIVKTLTNRKVAALLGEKTVASWYHRWDDGWGAQVTARLMATGERVRKSDGFCGYDWMVRNILAHGTTRAPGDR